MTGSPLSSHDPPVPPNRAPARRGRIGGLWGAARALWSRDAGSRRRREAQLARILDLFEEHVYAGEITPAGSYVDHASDVTLGSLIGGDVPADVESGEFWESRIRPRTGPSTRISTAACSTARTPR